MSSEPIGADAKSENWPEKLRTLAGRARHPLVKGYYEAGCAAADAPVRDVPLVALDFETTGLDPNQHSIVSVGLVPFTLNGIQLGAGRHWIVRPRLPLHQTSIEIHGITHADIAKAPDMEDILEPMFELMRGRIPVVHYRAIERGFLDVALKWRLGEGIQFPVLDTMAIEAHLHPHRNPTRWQQFWGKKPVSIRLPDSRTRYGLPHYAAHNALIDAIATAELLQAQVHHHFGPDTPVRDLWL
ncbi:3'-5' exonuclease [Marinobacter qingdaonensis]|jgi:DNA polymerase-3 subunit epsilon|uniref:3'-5' exonuclease n=1 Tax=Marinobacter qingdaonensis TaxID=3108486 RepID=A0ABU5NVX9_9GAMM|nr:3'-5' exonuclease [Marinobacter sp. ASW11-75]MEA1079965.1 3'-5' exonuclease [Marinobacter sp. ASW11-75]MEE2762804.1 3'-5' exonuclease [Pseudomonadota bacterium]